MRRATWLLLIQGWFGIAFAAVDEEERRVADCIDRYNSDAQFGAEAKKNIPENPGLIVHLRQLIGTHTADGFDTDAPQGFGYGGKFDLDTLITLFRSGHTRTGLAVGASALAYSVPNRTTAFGGELRLGLGRRRYGVPTYEPALLRFFQSSTCRFERMDLTLDLVHWRLHSLNDVTAPDQPTSLVSGISLIVPSQRFSFDGWGWKWGLSLADFRLRPSFQWGVSGSLEWSVRWLVLGGTFAVHVAPSFHALATASLGFRFEFWEGFSPGA